MNIIIYISNSCNDCKKALNILNKHKLQYTTINIQDLSFQEKISIFNLSKKSTIPIIKINDYFTTLNKLESTLKNFI